MAGLVRMAVRAGLPHRYSKQTAQEICRRIAMGETLLKICADDEFPCKSTVYNWIKKYPYFAELYTQARQPYTQSIAESVLAIADEVEPDRDHLARAKLQIDARKWFIENIQPIMQEVDDTAQSKSAGDDNPVLRIQVVRNDESGSY